MTTDPTTPSPLLTSAEEAPSPDALKEAWLAACEDTAHAYAAWCAASVSQWRLAYAAYIAAAEREAAAERACRGRPAAELPPLG